ncbi:MAG TPA: hypothetical protein PLE19_21405 [Planctomycetota bacterium]|nr:hypothetical protein [Planctomycetota bacterium]HRR82193.1 hypothetical protein [Planctomycetota bacterium]
MRRMAMVAMAAAVAVLAASALEAGEPAAAPSREKGEVTLSWDQFVKITGYDPAGGGGGILTIPWAEVQNLLGVKVEKMGQAATVDLPWTEFKALLEWSIQQRAGKAATPPPTDYVVSSCQFTGDLTDDGATLTLKLKADILRERAWTRIPVLPGTVAITRSTLPAGVFLNSSGQAYEILTDKTGTVDVAVEFSVAVEKDAGINRVTFQRVTPGASILDLVVARENVDVRVAGAQSQLVKTAAGKTQVAAAIASGVPLTVTWERALPKAEAVPPKLYAETNTMVAVAEGVLLCQETVNYNILHTPVRELKLKVPSDTSILTVTGANLQDWRVAAPGELTVVFRGEVIGAQQLTVSFERAVKDSVEAPVIRTVGVEREKGFIGVVAVTNVEITSDKVEGARPVDVRQLPSELVAMTKQPILLGFRYVGDTFTIPLTVKRHDEVGVLVTIVDSALFTGMQLNDGRRITKVVYSVRNNRNQFLRLKMPEGATIWSAEVSGNTATPARDDKGNVLIPLIRSASGAQELASFPVDIVYVEAPATAAPKRGSLRVDLPQMDAPTMHVMYNYYLPIEGHYRTWLLGKSTFAGPLREVEKFAALATGPERIVVPHDAQQQAQQMEEQVQARVEQEAKAAGAEPIRVRLPINGKLFQLEKILSLPSDELWFEVTYRGWEPAK